MFIPGLKPKIYVACVGMPDCGKSTFIRGIVKYNTQRDVPVDSFCDEQQLDMTIRSAQIFLRDKNLPYDIVFLDCPGHIFEFEKEAISVLSKAHFCIRIYNSKQLEVVPYNKMYEDPEIWNEQFQKVNINHIDTFDLVSHSTDTNWNHYDAFQGIEKYGNIFKNIIDFIDDKCFVPICPIETALRIIRLACSITGKRTLMCSYGKDSVLLLQLMKMCGCNNKTNFEYPNSGFDLPGISNEFKKRVSDFFNIKIEPFDVIQKGWNFDNHTTQEMMLCKARMLSERISRLNYKVCFTGIRRDEEGTRAKEKFFSPRKSSGEFNMLESQLELFGDELDMNIVENCDNIRVNPILDLCEADVWYATKFFGLPVCQEYFSKNGLRYRSLGDWPTTTPIKSNASTIDEICGEVDSTIIPERACRELQDNSVKYGMEKLRKVGFF